MGSNRAGARWQRKRQNDKTMSKGHSSGKGNAPMTMMRAVAIQSATARANGGKVASGSFAARAQSAAAHHVASGQTSGGTANGGKTGQ